MSTAAMEQLMAEAQQNVAEPDKEAELLTQLGTCPKCGSLDRYTEERRPRLRLDGGGWAASRWRA